MNHKPQSFTSAVAAAFLAGLSAVILTQGHFLTAGIADETPPSAKPAETPTPAAQQPAASPATPGDSAPVPTADELLTQVRSRLDGLDSLTCDLHQTAMLSGMKFIAAGRYVQASGRRFRLDFRIFPATSLKSADVEAAALEAELTNPPQPPADPPGTAPAADTAIRPGAPPAVRPGVKQELKAALTQVSDGSVLYSHWQNGPQSQVTRRNIDDILKAASEVTNYNDTRALQDLGLGGLNGLFARLQTTMDFSLVKRETIAGTELLVVSGKWNAKIRKEVFQMPDDAQIVGQDFVPEFVRIYVDAKSSLPRRIQYLKQSPATNSDPAKKNLVLIRPLLTLDLRQIVLNEPVPDSVFTFTAPANVKETDVTQATIGVLKGTAQPLAAPTVAPTGEGARPAPPAAGTAKPEAPSRK